MSVVILKDKLTKEDLQKAREDYDTYIKITIDIKKSIIAIGGQYHFDAEQTLINEYKSEQKDIWGGGYDLIDKSFRTDAMINMRPFHDNADMLIRDRHIENKFLELSKSIFKDIEQLI